MEILQGQRVLVTGGSKGLGLAIVEVLPARGAKVTVLVRARSGFHDVKGRGGDAIEGDATDAAPMDGLVADIQPSVLILNAGATSHMGAIDEQTSTAIPWPGIPTSKLLFTASRRH